LVIISNNFNNLLSRYGKVKKEKIDVERKEKKEEIDVEDSRDLRQVLTCFLL